MSKAKKDPDENEVLDQLHDNLPAGDCERSAKVIPIGDGEPEAAAEPVAAEEVDPIEQLQAQVAELEDQKLRALADIDNQRKRMARQLETVVQSANERLLIELLEVVDNFERALEHGANGGDDSAPSGGLVEGTALILQQMLDLLARHEVRPMETIGRPFDATYHEALMQVASDEYDEGTVVSEIRKGYLVGRRVLRHARVAVSRPADDDSSELGEE